MFSEKYVFAQQLQFVANKCLKSVSSVTMEITVLWVQTAPGPSMIREKYSIL
jgi:hypothetical protein